MSLSQSVSFLYNTQLTGLSADRNNLKGPLVIRSIQSWSLKDKLNKLNELKITVVKRDIDLNEVYFERLVFVSAFKFEGIITGLVDINDDTLEITVMEKAWHFTRRIYKIADSFKEYNISLVDPASLSTLVQVVLDSANADMPFTWILGDDIPATSDFDFDVKWKNYYEVLNKIAVESLNDLWFEGHEVKIGKKGKQIILDRDDKIYRKLQSKIDLDTYGNIINIVGAKSGGSNLFKTVSASETNLQYNYERVVSNNNLKSQTSLDKVADRILPEFNTIEPDVRMNISKAIVDKYDMESGDVILIRSNTHTQTTKGFYRIIEVVMNNKQSSIKLQFSADGKFLPRISDTLDMLEAAFIKLHDIELNG